MARLPHDDTEGWTLSPDARCPDHRVKFSACRCEAQDFTLEALRSMVGASPPSEEEEAPDSDQVLEEALESMFGHIAHGDSEGAAAGFPGVRSCVTFQAEGVAP